MQGIFFDVLYFSLLLSLATLGMGIASSKGAILYPLYLWITSFKDAKKATIGNILSVLNSEREEQFALIGTLPSNNNQRKQVAERIKEIDEYIKDEEEKLDNIYTWEKPIIACVKCMPSVWGVTIYLLLGLPIGVVPLAISILAACFLNTFIITQQYIEIER